MPATDTARRAAVEPIAVIGMAGRFPGANSIEEFWLRLAGDEVCGIDLPRPREAPGNWVGRAYQIEDPEGFDRHLFGMTSHDAEVTDPQHRLLLECAHQALEDAAIDPFRYTGAIGMFAGCDMSSYLLQHHGHDLDEIPVSLALALIIGNDKDHLSPRVSHRLGLTGPSVNVQTGCSTSLAAVHFACQALRNDECDIALAGGVSVRFPRDSGWTYDPNLVDSRDGMCRPFDAGSTGTVPGEGGAIVVLKPLRAAVRDGDHVYGTLLGSAINNDGARRAGYTSPGVDGQRDVVRRALRAAGVSADDVTFVEAHGTGTQLGDPIEVQALAEAFRSDTARTQYCAIGSVKSNMGHLNSAAGIAGLIKAVLAIDHEVIPGTPTFRSPSVFIDLPGSPFYVNPRSIRWAAGSRGRLAGVSSLGLGGTNVHVIAGPAPVTEAPARQADGSEHVLPVSAQTSSALAARVRQVTEHLTAGAGLASVAATLTLGRRELGVRRAVAVTSAGEAVRLLASPVPSASSRAGQAVLLFGGQGAQFVGMGLDLYQRSSLFRCHVDRCAELLRPRTSTDFRQALFAPEVAGGTAEMVLADTLVAQQALFSIQTGIVELLFDYGLRPAALVGQSIGEVAAAYAAGVLDLEQAVALVATRATVMQRAPSGAAFVVGLPEAEAVRLLDGTAEISGVNSDSEVVMSCVREQIGAVEEALGAHGCRWRRLRTSKPFHSAAMADAARELAIRFSDIRFATPRVPVISTVTGDFLTDGQATDGGYWADQVRAPVCSGAALRAILDIPGLVCVDVGPGLGMSRLVRMNSSGAAVDVLACLPQKGGGLAPSEASILAWLWERGVHVDLSRRIPARTVKARLPGYPMERERYSLERAGGSALAARPPRRADQPVVTPAAGADSGGMPDIVTAAICEVLGSRLAPDDDFFAAGLDSLSATQVVGRISRQLRAQVTVRELFNNSTINDLTALLSSRLAEMGS
jgi:acyl transferase domain-containing protein